MVSKKFICNLWKSCRKGNYIRVNKEDGSMPTMSEFKKMIIKYGN